MSFPGEFGVRDWRFRRWVAALFLALMASAFGLHAQETSAPRSPWLLPKEKSAPAAPATSIAPTPKTQTATTRKLDYEITVTGEHAWTDTSIDVVAGDRLELSGEGSVQYPMMPPSGPDGSPRTWRDVIRELPVNQAGMGALIGCVGDTSVAVPFLIGAKKEVVVRQAGRLFVGLNQAGADQAQGTFKVKVHIVPAPVAPGATARAPVSQQPAPGPQSQPNGTVAPAAAAATGSATETVAKAAAPSAQAAATSAATPAASAMPSPAENSFLTDWLAKLPRRVSDSEGHPGDMVNLVILGSEDDMRQAFQSAGWAQVDRTKSEAVLHAVLATINKQVYTEMPMSELYLFGRPQDYGFARAEAVQVVASRNHLRVWKTEVGGHEVWVGAATHDMGFEKDQRNGGVTHKIDPDVDLEREYVAQTLGSTGMATISYLTPPDPLLEAKTATGGEFHSDGRILLITLKSATK